MILTQQSQVRVGEEIRKHSKHACSTRTKAMGLREIQHEYQSHGFAREYSVLL